MPLIDPNDTIRIDLPTPGEWVEVRRQLSKGQEVEMRKSMLAEPPVCDATQGIRLDDLRVDWEAFELKIIELAIVRWSFPEPVTPENIRRLDIDSANYLYKRLNELYASRSPEERKNSFVASPTSS
jgi:hypothetical protein